MTILFAATTYADSFTFNTIPAGGNLTAAAGATAGWGYTVTNNSLDQWLMFSGLGASAFTNGTTDSGIFDFPIVAPGATVTQAYDAVNSLGLFAFTWNAGVPGGTTNSGNFVVSAEWWNDDPFTTGEFIEAAEDAVAPYSVTVPVSCNCNPEQVPEPSSFVLLACGMGSLFLLYRRKLQPGR